MPPAHAQDASALRAQHAHLIGHLASNVFHRPLVLASSEGSGDVKGDIYARVDQPFAVSGGALQGMDHWCEILMLHLNVKGCRASLPPAPDLLSVNIGRKFEQALADSYLFEFSYRVVSATPDYLQVSLEAPKGPLGTNGYRIVLEVAALDDGSSFLHLSYAYSFGFTARLALRGYLATLGRDKVGFSVTGRNADGTPEYIGGERGVVERNTMRYYLAIEAYLGSLSAPPPQQQEKRLADWFAGAESYAQQLHEIERDAYLSMKRNEFARMRQPSP
jgi:hypothetical protein